MTNFQKTIGLRPGEDGFQFYYSTSLNGQESQPERDGVTNLALLMKLSKHTWLQNCFNKLRKAIKLHAYHKRIKVLSYEHLAKVLSKKAIKALNQVVVRKQIIEKQAAGLE